MAKKHDAAKHGSAGDSRHGRGKQPKRQGGGEFRMPNAVWISAAIVALAAAAFLLTRPPQASPQPTLASEITAAQAFEEYQAGAFFLDVRTQAEWDQGHIARSTLIPLDELPNRLGEVPHDRDVVVVCRSGTRSKEGATILRQAGFTRVTCMTGGLQAWTAAGYAVEQ